MLVYRVINCWLAMVTQDILFETVDAKILAVQGSDQSLDF